MRSAKQFVTDIIRKPPLLFPWLALFHLFALCYTLYVFGSEPFPSIGWLRPLWMLAFFVCILFVCDRQRWAVWGYLALTVADMVLYLRLPAEMRGLPYDSGMFPIDVLFGFFILFYYKRLTT